jgi:4-hydroxythreonine-4-phosphate dehydrogenase
MYADWCGIKNFVMMFFSKKMNAALITIHEPVKNIPGLISKKLLTKKLKVVIDALRNDLKIKNPHIAILGLNPHAGEGGLIGLEEEEIVKPFIKEFADEMLSGPFSPDAFFANHLYKKYDVVIGMYHDQILIPFKMLNFNSGVNYTAGLPIVRTSPDHGVAYDIAGKNLANPASILEAYRFAEKIVRNRKQND